MKKNELRIGSLVRLSYMTEKALSVTAIENDSCWVKRVDLSFKINSIYPYVEPIPLTADWLEKLGFKPLCKDYQKKGVIIHTRKRGFVLNRKVPIIQHVHQLQNLFFALRGEELTIKED